MIYYYPKLSKNDFYIIRFGGAGLGNILFPWARAVKYSKIRGFRINATWNTMKIGPLLRGEFDKRTYSGLFDENEISGIKKVLLLSFGKKYTEEAYSHQKSIRPHICICEGMKNMFLDILKEHEFIKQELMRMVKPENIKPLKKYEKNVIAVHIRMGDFIEPKDEKNIREGNWNYRLPLRWYIEMINKIRNKCGWDIPVYIFSDGKDEELASILAINNIERRSFGSAISDILALSQSKLLIASASTFSMWASYLGRMPVLWFPGTHRQKLYGDVNNFEGEVDYNDVLPSKLCHNIQFLFSEK